MPGEPGDLLAGESMLIEVNDPVFVGEGGSGVLESAFGRNGDVGVDGELAEVACHRGGGDAQEFGEPGDGHDAALFLGDGSDADGDFGALTVCGFIGTPDLIEFVGGHGDGDGDDLPIKGGLATDE